MRRSIFPFGVYPFLFLIVVALSGGFGTYVYASEHSEVLDVYDRCKSTETYFEKLTYKCFRKTFEQGTE